MVKISGVIIRVLSQEIEEKGIMIVNGRYRLLLDSKLEQILCFDTAIDAKMFCKEKTAVFLVMPEEDNTKYFIIFLILQ